MIDTKQPVYLFHEGTNHEAYKLLSPSQVVEGGKKGWVFRVWAPHAKTVSVVGDFNYWDRSSNPMYKIVMAFVVHLLDVLVKIAILLWLIFYIHQDK